MMLTCNSVNYRSYVSILLHPADLRVSPTHVYSGTSGFTAALEEDLPHEPAGSEPVATGNISSCADFWRSFVRSSWVMDWIECGYRLMWEQAAPAPKESPNSPSAGAHGEFVSSAIAEMLLAGAITQLPFGARPAVVSPLGVVPKPRSEKLRLIINMRYVNRHLIKRVFKFEGLADLADLAKKGDFAISYDLTSGYYHVALHPSSRSFVGFSWKGKYYVYNRLPFGLSTAPWVFSKVMRELVMFWRRSGIRVLPYLDDFLFLEQGEQACLQMSRRVESDFFAAGLQINKEKCCRTPSQQIRHLGFDVDLAAGKFSVPSDKWEALKASVDALLTARRGRVQARTVASLVGTVISMRLAWGPVSQLYTRHLYALINSVVSLNCWIVVSEEAANELLFWQQLPQLRFVADIWPCTKGLAVRVATDASDMGWGGITLTGPREVAHEYFTEEESRESSTFRELLGVRRCLQALVRRCEGRLVVLQVDAMNLLGVINRGSRRLALNELARDLFWFCLRHEITLSVEWVPREENSLADDISKLLIPDDWMLSKKYFQLLDRRWGPHTCDLFASQANNQCAKFYSLHWCRGSAGVNAFGYDWSTDNCWVNCPYRLIGRVWRCLQAQGAAASLLVPLWESATWWQLVTPEVGHLSDCIVDWVWLPREDPSLFCPGTVPGRPVEPPNWPVMAVRVDFSQGRATAPLCKRDRCIEGGCSACCSSVGSWRQ